jgi:AcrR family transcriptional regulator
MNAAAPTQDSLDTRSRILEAAAQCIADEGIAAVRMAGIARAAGVSTALLHYHFATKDQLFESVLRYSYESSTVLDQAALRGAGRPAAERLAVYLDRCLPSDPELVRDWLLWQELGLMCLRQPQLAAVNADLYQATHENLAAIIREGIAEGSFRDCDADQVAQAAVALCDGLGNRVLSDDPRTTLADARLIVATAVGALVGAAGPLPLPDVGGPPRLPTPRTDQLDTPTTEDDR